VFVVRCSASDLCDVPITQSEESYHMFMCVLIVCDLETSTIKRARSELGCRATENKAVNRCPFTAKARVQSQAGPCGICIRPISIGIGFSRCTWMLLFLVSFR